MVAKCHDPRVQFWHWFATPVTHQQRSKWLPCRLAQQEIPAIFPRPKGEKSKRHVSQRLEKANTPIGYGWTQNRISEHVPQVKGLPDLGKKLCHFILPNFGCPKKKYLATKNISPTSCDDCFFHLSGFPVPKTAWECYGLNILNIQYAQNPTWDTKHETKSMIVTKHKIKNTGYFSVGTPNFLTRTRWS